ncbi:rhomboid family intramembrane serine protease [Trebonia sp.]|uniref:rhomboid family intramembrane serine protease n=1 Tax=Trebonia sp. TaxID=2767075 RepID=UPI0026016F4F|nr:rhomboid family intramembrane serine protease [Trebonia sp.]
MTASDQASHPGQDSPPTCYRHPDRETWVSCVRCGRHACPDCLRQAAVGQQCVECVRGAGHGARQARTVFGGRPSRTAVVTWTILGLNVLLYLVELAHPSLAEDWWMIGYAGPPLQGVADGQWYRLLTSAFLPGTGSLGLLDIAFNMWALWIVGPGLEQLLGRVRFLAVYLLSAVGGSVLFYYLAAPNQPALGASGAIFGLFGAWFVVSRRLNLDSRGIVMLIAINLALSFIYRSTIAWQDHVGGLIVGALITAAYAYAPRKNRLAVQLSASVAVVAILAVAIVIRNGQLNP